MHKMSDSPHAIFHIVEPSYSAPNDAENYTSYAAPWRQEGPSPNDTYSCSETKGLYLILMAIYIAIAVSGCAGNILSFVVLHWRSCANATNLLLKGLSLIDTVLLFCAILRVIYIEIAHHNACHAFVTVLLGNAFVRSLMTLAQFISVWVIVVLAFFRYMAICRPFSVAQWCSRQTARKALLVITLAGFLVWAPYFCQLKITRIASDKREESNGESPETDTDDVIMRDLEGNPTAPEKRHCYTATSRDWTQSAWYKLYDGAFAHIGSMFLIPFIPLLVFNAGMMRELYCQNSQERDRLHLPKRTREVHEITKVVIAIVIAFLISYSMYFIYILHHYTPALARIFEPKCTNTKDLFIFCIRTVALLNSCVNFIIYFVLRKSFRRKVLRLLCRCNGRDACIPTGFSPNSTHSMVYSYRSTRKYTKNSPSSESRRTGVPKGFPDSYKQVRESPDSYKQVRSSVVSYKHQNGSADLYKHHRAPLSKSNEEILTVLNSQQTLQASPSPGVRLARSFTVK